MDMLHRQVEVEDQVVLREPDKDGLYWFTASTPTLNRHKLNIITDGIDLDAFKKNPVVSVNHFSTMSLIAKPEDFLPIGQAPGIDKTKERLRLGVRFDSDNAVEAEANRAKVIESKWRDGFMNASSVGLMLTMYPDELPEEPAGEVAEKAGLTLGQLGADDEKQMLTPVWESELSEVAIATIPSNSATVGERDIGLMLIRGFANVEAGNMPEAKELIHAAEILWRDICVNAYELSERTLLPVERDTGASTDIAAIVRDGVKEGIQEAVEEMRPRIPQIIKDSLATTAVSLDALPAQKIAGLLRSMSGA